MDVLQERHTDTGEFRHQEPVPIGAGDLQNYEKTMVSGLTPVLAPGPRGDMFVLPPRSLRDMETKQ